MKIYLSAWMPLITSLVVGQMNAQDITPQDTAMNRTMRLERDYSPVVQQKNKIDRQPATQEVQTKKADATLADWQVTPVRSAEIGVVPAGQVIATPSTQQDGYLQFSAGSYWNADLRFGLFVDEFSLEGSGYFTRAKLDLPNQVINAAGDSLYDDTWQARYLNGNIKASYQRELGNEALFSMHLGATGTTVNTFNYQFYGTSTDTLIQVGSKPGRQHWGKIFGDVGFESDQFAIGAFYDYSHLTSADSLHSDQSASTLLLRGKVGWYDNDNWRTSIDLDLGGVFGKEKTYFICHPTLHLSLLPDPLAWRRLYVDLGFGSRRTDLDQLMQQLPIAYFPEEYESTVDAMDFHLGYEDNDQGYLRWGVEMQLAFANNAICAEAVPVDTTSRDGMYMRVYQDEDFHFGLLAHADYEYNRYFGLKADMELSTHSSTAAYLLDPAFSLNLHALSHPGQVALDLGFNIESASKTIYRDEEFDLGGQFAIDFRSDWQCRDDFSLFLLMHAITGGINEIFPGVPERKFNLSAGFKWEF
ncbi:MAG: hypothetical protein K6E86_00245 [Bacteroidales bacterium]|nr:hypothetical protein [Bacteroidales bacterium]